MPPVSPTPVRCAALCRCLFFDLLWYLGCFVTDMRRQAYIGPDLRGAACVCRRSSEVAQRAALAHVVVGMAQRRPNLLQVAEALLSSITVGARLSQQPAGQLAPEDGCPCGRSSCEQPCTGEKMLPGGEGHPLTLHGLCAADQGAAKCAGWESDDSGEGHHQGTAECTRPGCAAAAGC